MVELVVGLVVGCDAAGLVVGLAVGSEVGGLIVVLMVGFNMEDSW